MNTLKVSALSVWPSTPPEFTHPELTGSSDMNTSRLILMWWYKVSKSTQMEICRKHSIIIMSYFYLCNKIIQFKSSGFSHWTTWMCFHTLFSTTVYFSAVVCSNLTEYLRDNQDTYLIFIYWVKKCLFSHIVHIAKNYKIRQLYKMAHIAHYIENTSCTGLSALIVGHHSLV